MAVVIALAVGFGAGWAARRPNAGQVSAGGEQSSEALVTGQLLLATPKCCQSPSPVAGEVLAGNIYQIGPPLPRAEAASDGTFSMYLDPGRYTITGTTPVYPGGRTCPVYQVPNSTITPWAGDHLSIELLCR